jgi:hypothetical protein
VAINPKKRSITRACWVAREFVFILFACHLSLPNCGSSAARNVTKFEAFGNKEAESKELIINSGIEVNLWEVCSDKVKVKFTPVQAPRLCTRRTAYRGSRGIALPIHDHGTRRG